MLNLAGGLASASKWLYPSAPRGSCESSEHEAKHLLQRPPYYWTESTLHCRHCPNTQAGTKLQLTMVERRRNTAEYDKKGRCVRHPNIRLRKKKIFGGWKISEFGLC